MSAPARYSPAPMPRSEDLHGSAPDDADAALVLIDVINDLEFPGGDHLLEHALPMAQKLAALKERCRRAGIPAIYVNDNFGHWQSNLHRLIAHCRSAGVRGKPVVEALLPGKHDYFVIKPKSSGFYSTSLEILLDHLSVKTLILTGIAGDNCVLFTAHDAYLREYGLFVPSDCIASINPKHNATALAHMKRVLKVDARPSTRLRLDRLNPKRSKQGERPGRK